MITLRPLLTRAALLLAVVASFTILTGCACEARHDSPKTSPHPTADGKDTVRLSTTGPHQGN